MDSDEEEGLRAFALTVGTGPEVAYPGRPTWVEQHGVRRDIVGVDATWREEERMGFRVRLADGLTLLLYYVPELDLWSGVVPDREAAQIVRRRL